MLNEASLELGRMGGKFKVKNTYKLYNSPEESTTLKTAMQSKGVFAADKRIVKIIEAARDAKIKEMLNEMKTPENAEFFADGLIEEDIKEFKKVSNREIFRNTKLYDFLKNLGKAISSGLGLINGFLGNTANVINDLIANKPSDTSDFNFKSGEEVDEKLGYQITKIKTFVENVSKLVKECEKKFENATPEQITAFVNEKMEEYMQLAEAAAEIKRNKGKEESGNTSKTEEASRVEGSPYTEERQDRLTEETAQKRQSDNEPKKIIEYEDEGRMK